MIYSVCALALLNGVSAFQAGAMPASVRAAVARPSMATMQVAEAEVASPVALAKVRSRERHRMFELRAVHALKR